MASVRSAEELVLALDSGERDIVLHSHIHLRTLQLNRRIDNLLVLSSTTKSLRGECGKELKPVPEDAVEKIVSKGELLPGQCVIYGIGRILTIKAEDEVLVEGVVLAQEIPTRELYGDVGGGGAFALTAESGSVYLSRTSVLGRTGVAIELNSPSLLPALQIGTNVTAAYIEDSRFRGSGEVGHNLVTVKAPSTFQKCIFGPALPPPGEPLDYAVASRARAVGGDTYAAPPSCLVLVGKGGSASIVESIFDVTGQVNYKVCRLSGDQLVYMDEDLKVGAWLGDETPSLPVSAAPQQAFLTQADFLGVRQEVLNLEDTGSGLLLPVWAIAALSAAAMLIAVFGVAVFLSRWRSRRAPDEKYHTSSGGDQTSDNCKSQQSSSTGTDSRIMHATRVHLTAATLDAPLSAGTQDTHITHTTTVPSTQHSTLLPAESESTVDIASTAHHSITPTEQQCSSVLMSMPKTNTVSRVSESFATTGPADLNVNYSSNPPTLSTFLATTKPGQAVSSFQHTSQALATSMLRHHDALRRGAAAPTDPSHKHSATQPQRLSLINAGTSFEPSQNELNTSMLGDFIETHTPAEQHTAADDFSLVPPDGESMPRMHAQTTQASGGPLALGGVPKPSSQGSSSDSGAGRKQSSSRGSKKPTSGEHYKKKSTVGSGTPGEASSSDNKPPQAVQQKALQLQPTKQIVRDLENVPPGFPVHGYSLVRGQMLRGGQGVVHFVLDPASRQYAMKFFLSHSAFRAECALYNHLVLSRFLPQRHETISPKQAKAAAAQCENDAAVGALQWPCLVLEQGEDLQSICSREDSVLGPLQIRQALFDIGTCLKELHEANYVHRDIKPSNVINLPARQVWRLIDCGLANKVGAVVPVGFTRPWAPPEAIAADMKASQATSPEESYHASLHTVSPALDAWSFGVVAYELVTTPTHIRPAVRGQLAEINAQIVGAGDRELPWEGSNRAAAEEQLGALAAPILGLLERNPEDRWTLERFCSAIYPRHAGPLQH